MNKTYFLIIPLVALLASCGNTSVQNTTVTPTNTGVTISGANATGASSVTVGYPSTQQDTPATKFCTSKWGKPSVEMSGSLEVAYCTVNWQKVDAWKYMNENQ